VLISSAVVHTPVTLDNDKKNEYCKQSLCVLDILLLLLLPVFFLPPSCHLTVELLCFAQDFIQDGHKTA
jgi:hypothetical protein